MMGRLTAVRDEGLALVSVICLGLIMLMLVATGLTAASSGLRQADSSQDSSGALDAAYAGVQDYLARINLNVNYLQYGNTASPFSATSVLTLPSDNKAFLLGTNTADWAVVPGSDGLATFRYQVDTSAFASSGVVRLQTTGRVGSMTKTILATFRVRGFIDYTYFTDYEIQDPIISGVDPTTCVLHAWEGRPSSCPVIQFGKFDNLNGRVHSNDTLVVCGATFTGSVTTANPGSPLYVTPSTCTNGSLPISRAAQLPMPSTNTSMRTDARCVYTGPTRITYTNDGYMTVVSPWTKYTDVDDTPSNPAACGSLSDLRSTSGARVPQLNGDALYVQSVPGVASDPNYWDSTSRPSGMTCLDATGSATTNSSGVGWSFAGSSTTIRYPLTNEIPATNWRTVSGSTYQWSTATPAYGCRSGDLFVQGTVTTATTAAAENYVYIIGDVLYADKTQDVLGLVGQNAVLVWNPLNSAKGSILGDSGREVDAALLSVAHTFQVQNYDAGPNRGTLTVFGSIAQKFRGTVATANGNSVATGYAKAYSYDPLLSTVTPPKYLSPSAISFTLQRYASVATAFDATGAAR